MTLPLPHGASPRRRLRLAVGAGLLVVLPACGGGGSSAESTATSAPGTDGDRGGRAAEIAIVAGEFYLKPAAVTVPAGRIKVSYMNEGQLQHELLVDGERDLQLSVDPNGDTDNGTIELDPGEYVLYCDIPAHRRRGMEAKLTVE